MNVSYQVLSEANLNAMVCKQMDHSQSYAPIRSPFVCRRSYDPVKVYIWGINGAGGFGWFGPLWISLVHCHTVADNLLGFWNRGWVHKGRWGEWKTGKHSLLPYSTNESMLWAEICWRGPPASWTYIGVQGEVSFVSQLIYISVWASVIIPARRGTLQSWLCGFVWVKHLSIDHFTMLFNYARKGVCCTFTKILKLIYSYVDLRSRRL